MTKSLRKAIMKRSELESKYVKNKTSKNLKSYIKKEISAVTYIKEKEKKYYERLYLNYDTDNKKFLKIAKPLLSDKITTFAKILLVENDEIISK